MPTTGRALRLEGGGGRWEKYAGATVLGGVLLVGSNFAPTDFLWCRFGVPSEHATRRGPWRYSRAVYLNATQVRCEVPAGYAGDFSVSASHDDRMYSDDYKEWQIRPCTMPEIVRLATPKLNMKLYASVEEFEALGIEVLELELTRKSMRCGGSLHEMARRLYHWKFEHLHTRQTITYYDATSRAVVDRGQRLRVPTSYKPQMALPFQVPWTTYPIDLASRMPGYPANPTVNPYPEAGYYDIKSPREEFERSLV